MRKHRWRALAGVLATLLVAPSMASAGNFDTFVELPAEGSSSVSAVIGSAIGVTNQPRTFRFGVDYGYSVNGPLLLDVGAQVGIAGDIFLLHLAPGIRYLAPMSDLTFVPYGKVALAVDLLSGGGTPDRDLAVGIKLGAGLHYFFHEAIAIGPELSLTAGTASGDSGSDSALQVDALLTVAWRVP